MWKKEKTLHVELDNVAVPEIRIGEAAEEEEAPRTENGKKHKTRIDYSGAVPEIVVIEE